MTYLSWDFHWCNLKTVLFYLFKRISYRETRRDADKFSILWLTFPNSYNDQSWTGLKLGARSFLELTHLDVGAQILGPSFADFPDYLQWAESEVGILEFELLLIWDADTTGKDLACHTIVPAQPLMGFKENCYWLNLATHYWSVYVFYFLINQSR